MSFLSHERVTATAAVKTVADLTIPSSATGVQLQADTGDVRYTMDGSSDPSQTEGLILHNGRAPEEFLIDDLIRLRFTRGQGSDAGLNVHYFAGRADLGS